MKTINKERQRLRRIVKLLSFKYFVVDINLAEVQEKQFYLSTFRIKTNLIHKMEDTLARESDLTLAHKSKSIREIEILVSSHLTWSSRYKCFQAYLCYVMSFLSALKFFERAGNYKVAIFIPYLVCNVLIGIPAVFVEIMLGRFVMGNVYQAWNMSPPSIGIFWCLFIVTVYAITINHIYNSYLLQYIFASIRGTWADCNHDWNTINCFNIGGKALAYLNCLDNHSESFCRNLTWESSAWQFWKYRIRSKTDGIEIFLAFLFLFVSVTVVAGIIFKGIRSLEKLLGLLVYPSVILWVILVIVSFSSVNALEGFKTLFRFQWAVFLNPKMWVEGFEDTFFLLGLGKLSLSFISSHGKFTDNILYDVMVVIFGSVTSCLLLTVPILSVVATTKYLDEHGNMHLDDTTDVFVSISEAFLFFPTPKTLWAAVYYADCFIMSVSSQAVLALALCEAVEGLLKKKFLFYIILIFSFASFLVAGTFRFLEFTQDINHTTFVLTTTVLCTITWQLFYGIRKFNSDYFFMMGYPIPMFLKCSWITLLLVPVVGLILKIYYNIPNKPFPFILYIYVGIPLFIYISVIIVKLAFAHQNGDKLSVFMPNPDWGPESALLKKSRAVFETSTVTREFMYRQELYKKPLIKAPDYSQQNIVQLM